MAIDSIRKNHREQATEEIQDVVDTGTAVSTLGMQATPVEDSVVGDLTMKEAIRTLKEPEQEVLSMKIFGDLTFTEIAKILQQPMGTVTWRYRTAIEKLRKSYGKEVRR